MVRYSVIIPVYNLANYIERTLEGLKGAHDTEIVLVDDGSADNSAEVIEKYISSHPEADIKFFSQSNQGVSAARNEGMAKATGEYLVFADGDDILSWECLNKVYDKSADVIVWRFETEKNGKRSISQKEFEKKQYQAEEFVESLLKGINKIRIGSFAVKKELIDKYNIRFTEGCAICEDVEFMYKCFLTATTVDTADDTGYVYIRREGSAINTFDMKRFEAPVAIERVYQYAKGIDGKNFNEFIMDSLKYGLYITHTMYSFDSCCRFIKDNRTRKQFLNDYYRDCEKIEQHVKEAKRNMKYKPVIYSKKRLMMFLLSRKLYTAFVSR